MRKYQEYVVLENGKTSFWGRIVHLRVKRDYYQLILNVHAEDIGV